MEIRFGSIPVHFFTHNNFWLLKWFCLDGLKSCLDGGLMVHAISYSYQLYFQIPLWLTISMAIRNLSMGRGLILDEAALAEATARQGQLATVDICLNLVPFVGDI